MILVWYLGINEISLFEIYVWKCIFFKGNDVFDNEMMLIYVDN